MSNGDVHQHREVFAIAIQMQIDLGVDATRGSFLIFFL
jgi:hypothetical protein